MIRPFWKKRSREPGRHRFDASAAGLPRESQQALEGSTERLERDNRETIHPLREMLAENHVEETIRKMITEGS